MVDEDGGCEHRHEESERQEEEYRARVVAIEPLGGLLEIREDARMQVEQVDGERRSSDAVDEKVGEAQPRRRRQDEQGAEDDVWGGIKKSTATPYVRDYPPP